MVPYPVDHKRCHAGGNMLGNPSFTICITCFLTLASKSKYSIFCVAATTVLFHDAPWNSHGQGSLDYLVYLARADVKTKTIGS